MFDINKLGKPRPSRTDHTEIGTAKMGRDPKTSVLNGFNQSHDIPDLFLIGVYL